MLLQEKNIVTAYMSRDIFMKLKAKNGIIMNLYDLKKWKDKEWIDKGTKPRQIFVWYKL